MFRRQPVFRPPQEDKPGSRVLYQIEFFQAFAFSQPLSHQVLWQPTPWAKVLEVFLANLASTTGSQWSGT